MPDDLAMTCDRIKKKLKSFQQDLLAEREYKAFVDHLDKCPKCKEYVGSIDFLSNQLWKLGDVEVPADLGSTILFELTQTEQEAQAPKFVITEKLALRAFVLVLLGALVFFGIRYQKNRSRSQEIAAPEVVEVQEIEKEEPVSDRKMFFEDTVIMAEDDSVEEVSLDTEEPSSTEDEEFVVKPKPLHWHFLYPAEESKKQKSFSEKRQGEAKRKAKLLNVLNTLGVSLDYQESDILAFLATGEKVELVLEQILLISAGNFSFGDFTPGVRTFLDKEHSTSVYLEKKGASTLHWHVVLPPSYQKSRFLDMVREKSGITYYESEQLVVFSIQRAEVEKLKTRILAMRANFSEFGYLEPQGNQLTSGSTKISIYFVTR